MRVVAHYVPVWLVGEFTKPLAGRAGEIPSNVASLVAITLLHKHF